MHNDDDNDLGLSAMMAHAVKANTSRPSRGRESKDRGGSRSSSRSVSRSSSRQRSRSSSILRKVKGSKKKDSTPSTPRRDRSRDSGFDDDRSVASRKSVKSTRSRSRAAGSKKKSVQRLTNTQSKASSPEIVVSPDSASSRNKDERKKTKKKSKKIKRIRKPGEVYDSGDDMTISSKQSTRSTKSSDSLRSKVSRYKNNKNKLTKQYKEISTRVESIREPILSNKSVILNDEMDNLFPLPKSPSKLGKTARRGSMGKSNGVESNFNSDTEDINRSVHSKPSSKSIIKPQSQKSIGSGSNSSYGIMTNKAAEEQAVSALNRVAAHQQMEMNNSQSGGSEVSGGERQFRRLSNGSRRNEQYERLRKDSGLTSLTSINDNDDDASHVSYSSRRSQSNFTAMSALQKRTDEYKAETEILQKRLYEALADVEQSNRNLRHEKERAKTAEGDLTGVKDELEQIQDEKLFLMESVRDMETEFVAKGERVERLQEVVETQLNTVEFLEDKLNKTEDELVLMEEEINELVHVVEEKKKSDDQINTVVSQEEKKKSNEQIDKVVSKKQGRVARMVSMREDMVTRKGSILEQKEESRRVLQSPQDHPKSADRSPMKSMVEPVNESQEDAEKLRSELKTREAKLKAGQEECDKREQHLDTWERQIFDLEDQVKKESEKNSVAHEEVASTNSEYEKLIASLEKEKERLRSSQIDNRSTLKKLEFENEDLRVKLDRITKMTEKTRRFPVKEKELSDALALVDKKIEIIQSLEEKIKMLGEKDENDKSEEEGKDLLIRELQNQLVNTKKEANSLSSGSYVTRLKLEIKKLRESVRDLKKKQKEEELTSRSNLQKKEDSMKLFEKQMHKLKIELERRDKREKNFGTSQNPSNSDFQNHIEDLEDEISHWKSTNADLENEVESLKSSVHEQAAFYQSDDESDDCSIGSLASVNSRMSLSVSHEDNFFLTDSSSMSSFSGMDDQGAPSKRVMRNVTSLWSKMRNGPEPPNPNQAFPYGPGSLNDG